MAETVGRLSPLPPPLPPLSPPLSPPLPLPRPLAPLGLVLVVDDEAESAGLELVDDESEFPDFARRLRLFFPS